MSIVQGCSIENVLPGLLSSLVLFDDDPHFLYCMGFAEIFRLPFGSEAFMDIIVGGVCSNSQISAETRDLLFSGRLLSDMPPDYQRGLKAAMNVLSFARLVRSQAIALGCESAPFAISHLPSSEDIWWNLCLFSSYVNLDGPRDYFLVPKSRIKEVSLLPITTRTERTADLIEDHSVSNIVAMHDLCIAVCLFDSFCGYDIRSTVYPVELLGFFLESNVYSPSYMRGEFISPRIASILKSAKSWCFTNPPVSVCRYVRGWMTAYHLRCGNFRFREECGIIVPDFSHDPVIVNNFVDRGMRALFWLCWSAAKLAAGIYLPQDIDSFGLYVVGFILKKYELDVDDSCTHAWVRAVPRDCSSALGAQLQLTWKIFAEW